MVEFLTMIRAGKWHVVTALKCRIHCFNSYLIPFRNYAVIMRRHFLWLHGDWRGGIFCHFLMQFMAPLLWTIILQRTYALWIVCLLRAPTRRDLTVRSLGTWRASSSTLLSRQDLTHIPVVPGRQHAWWLQITHEGQSGEQTCFLNMQAFQRSVRNSLDVALHGRMHVTYWSNARQHARCRKARRYNCFACNSKCIFRTTKQSPFHAHALHQHFVNTFWALSLVCLFLCRAC